MRMLRYESGTGGETVELDGPGLSLNRAEGLHGTRWSYDLGYRGISGLSQPSREVTLTLGVSDMGEYERARHVFGRDVSMLAPGELVYAGEWRTRAYMVNTAAGSVFHGIVSTSLTVVLVDGVWRKEVTKSFMANRSQESTVLDLPYDLPYDLGPVPFETEAQGPEWMPSPVRITVYGPASNPEVVIGGNSYSVSGSVADGGYLVIDGLSMEVYEIAADGTRTDRLADAELGSGAGSGEYAFERIKPGVQSLSWSHAFGFDLTYWIEEGEPPCC